MRTFWSDQVQGVKTLFMSRSLRFKEEYFKDYEKIFDLDRDKKLKVLELGCGPGALIHAMSEAYPNFSFTGLDNDINFINFAQEFVKGGEFVLGDIEYPPFEEESFDVIISYTLKEHIESDLFIETHEKLLKKGGKMIVISVNFSDSDIFSYTYIGEEGERREKEILARLINIENEDFEEEEVGAHRIGEGDLARRLAEHSFENIELSHVFSEFSPDKEGTSEELANFIFDSEKIGIEEMYERFYRDDHVSDEEAEILFDNLDKKLERRKEDYNKGIKVWDRSLVLAYVLTAIKC